jgi:hypothetical protein
MTLRSGSSLPYFLCYAFYFSTLLSCHPKNHEITDQQKVQAAVDSVRVALAADITHSVPSLNVLIEIS